MRTFRFNNTKYNKIEFGRNIIIFPQVNTNFVPLEKANSARMDVFLNLWRRIDRIVQRGHVGNLGAAGCHSIALCRF